MAMKLGKRRPKHIETRPTAGFDDIERSAFELLCVFMADQPIQKLLGKYAFDGISSCFNDLKLERALRLLIEIATFYRLHYWAFDPKKKAAENGRNVGCLSVDNAKEDVDLCLHEACNKIIHAKIITFEIRKVPKVPCHYLKQAIVLEGDRSGKKWSAIIDIVLFCDEVLLAPHPDDLPF